MNHNEQLFPKTSADTNDSYTITSEQVCSLCDIRYRHTIIFNYIIEHGVITILTQCFHAINMFLQYQLHL